MILRSFELSFSLINGDSWSRKRSVERKERLDKNKLEKKYFVR